MCDWIEMIKQERGENIINISIRSYIHDKNEIMLTLVNELDFVNWSVRENENENRESSTIRKQNRGND